MNFLNLTAEWWIKWAFAVVAGAIIGVYRYLRQKQKDQEKRQQALEMGVQAILRDRIVQAYYHYHSRGNITLHGLENVKNMYNSYHALGGNGPVTRLVNALSELEVVDD